jgi:hypothetical protein
VATVRAAAERASIDTERISVRHALALAAKCARLDTRRAELKETETATEETQNTNDRIAAAAATACADVLSAVAERKRKVASLDDKLTPTVAAVAALQQRERAATALLARERGIQVGLITRDS